MGRKSVSYQVLVWPRAAHAVVGTFRFVLADRCQAKLSSASSVMSTRSTMIKGFGERIAGKWMVVVEDG